MSYQVLARKWRPHSFSTLIGQDHVVRALTHALTENRLHHAYLFTGTRGVGKTTISRILAKCLNCVGPDGKGGITPEPCGVCPACRAIDEDRFVDYIEMDAASTRGIDDMVALLERAKYAPTDARFKVYMIDEVHQLTTQAFNAMLKTLEEPPEYVKFILATTDPQKVPITVLSRCLQFNLKSLSPAAISKHMASVLSKEGIGFEKSALQLLASGAQGSMRDGLSLLDQAIAYSQGNLTLDAVREMLGTIDSTTLVRLLQALATKNARVVMEVADEIGMRSLSYSQAMKDLALLLHKIAIVQQLPETLSVEEPDFQAVSELSQAFTPDEVQLYYQIAINGRNDIHLAPDEYAGFTMALLRMLAFAPNGIRLKAKVAPLTHKSEEALRKVVEPQKEQSNEQNNDRDLLRQAPNERTELKEVKPTSQKHLNEQDAIANLKGETPPPWEEDSNGPKAESVVAAAGTTDQLEQAANEAKIKELPPLPPEASIDVAEERLSALPADEEDADEFYGEPMGESFEGSFSSQVDEEPDFPVIPKRNAGPSAAEKFLAEDSVKEDNIPEVKSNKWLELADSIELKASSQPLVTTSELVSFEPKKLVLNVGLKTLTKPQIVKDLHSELKNRFGEDFILEVNVAPTHHQTLEVWRKQQFLKEKQGRLPELLALKEVKSFLKNFGGKLDAADIVLLDKDGNPREY